MTYIIPVRLVRCQVAHRFPPRGGQAAVRVELGGRAVAAVDPRSACTQADSLPAPTS